MIHYCEYAAFCLSSPSSSSTIDIPPKPNYFSLFHSTNAAAAKRRSLSLHLQSRPFIRLSAKPRWGVVSSRSEQVVSAAAEGDSTTGSLSDDGTVGKRTDINKVLILGAGPSVMGQACGFDYSGAQACKALREEGYLVVVVNSNPTTIMTDPEMADRTYIEPMTPEFVEQVIEKERPDALLATMGGQTAINLAVALAERGVLEKYGVELIGAKLEAIKKAEDRDLFKQAMKRIGMKTPPSRIGTSIEECYEIADSIIQFPLIVRPAYTVGGNGSGIAYNMEEFEEICKSGLDSSFISQVLVEKSLFGWKEYEFEVMRDSTDNVVIICSIENIDPMGIHTGDSITVAPAQTLTDKEYQKLRDYSIAIVREIGVDGGASNVQFAVNPKDGEVMVIGMNPRISRSAALASIATGFPMAKVAAKLSVGYRLDQILSKKVPASFEPSMDCVVTKIPRFAFEILHGYAPTLTTQMQSIGESIAIGCNFQESFQKALRSLDYDYNGRYSYHKFDKEKISDMLPDPTPDRINVIYTSMWEEMGVDHIYEQSFIDKWFLTQLKELVDMMVYMSARYISQFTKEDFHELKSRGFSDEQIASKTESTEKEVRLFRLSLGVKPVYRRIGRYNAKFETNSLCMYSSYDYDCESLPTQRKKVLILGGGPNRIGQGTECDYCCCHASSALQNIGYETIMMNSNPGTVSSNYDVVDRFYFEPLTVEDVLNIIDLEQPDGIIVQFGGRTSLKLALCIQEYLDETHPGCKSGTGFVRIWGTSVDSIDVALNMERFSVILKQLEIEQPQRVIYEKDIELVNVKYSVVARPSHFLAGNTIEIVSNSDKLFDYVADLRFLISCNYEELEQYFFPMWIFKYLFDAIEVNVDALGDSHGNVVIGGILEHVDQVGVHSGHSTCMIPTKTISQSCLNTIRTWTIKLAKKLNVCGLMNCRYAVSADGAVFLLEANPCASSFVPFVSKAIGYSLAKYASLVMSGKSLYDLNFTKEIIPEYVFVKEIIFPFEKFQGTDKFSSLETRSIGEVMGIYFESSIAFAKAQMASGQRLPLSGTVFLSFNDSTKSHLIKIVKEFLRLEFRMVSTSKTADIIESLGIIVERVPKMHQGRPHVGDMIASKYIHLMVITTSGDEHDLIDGRDLRRMAFAHKIPLVTTVAGALAVTKAIWSLKYNKIEAIALQDYFCC